MFKVADILVHEVKSSVREQRSKATSQLVVRILSECTFLHRRQLTYTRPDLLRRCSQLLYDNISMSHHLLHEQCFHCQQLYNGSLDKKDNTRVNTVLNTRVNTGDNT